MPVDADLGRAEVALAGQEQNLGVKGEPVQRLRGKQGLCRRPREYLEPALGVRYARGGQQPREYVEHPTHQAAATRFADAPASGGFPGADHYIGSRRLGRQQPGEEFDGHGQIGVAEESIFAARGEHPPFHRRALTPVREGMHVETRVGLREFPNDGRRGVLAAVIGYDDFPSVGAATEVAVQRGQGFRQPPRFVIGGDHHRKVTG